MALMALKEKEMKYDILSLILWHCKQVTTLWVHLFYWLTDQHSQSVISSLMTGVLVATATASEYSKNAASMGKGQVTARLPVILLSKRQAPYPHCRLSKEIYGDSTSILHEVHSQRFLALWFRRQGSPHKQVEPHCEVGIQQLRLDLINNAMRYERNA